MNRKTARENTFILLFEGVCKGDETAEEIFAKAVEYRDFEYDDYVKGVFFGAYENAQIIGETVETSLCGWKKERVSPVSTALFRLATYEMMFLEDIPAKVSINEAIELSKKYDDEKAYVFVNGVLNAVAEKLGRK
jgi:N utilization substance protein B